MKKTILALAALLAGLSSFAQDAGKSSNLSVSLDVTYVSDYVFRGVRLSDSAIQPSIEATYGDFYAGVWHSSSLNNDELVETDLYAGYNLAINQTFSADIGVTHYINDNVAGSQNTTETFAGVKADVFLSPSLYYYYDFDLNVSSYIASIGHSVPVAKLGVSLDFSATLGYVQIPGSPGADYCFHGAGVAIPYKISENATLTGALNYTNTDRSFQREEWVYSVGVSVGF